MGRSARPGHPSADADRARGHRQDPISPAGGRRSGRPLPRRHHLGTARTAPRPVARPPGIAQTLEIREHPGQAPSDAIASALAASRSCYSWTTLSISCQSLRTTSPPCWSLPDSPAPRHQPRADPDRWRGKLARSDARRERGRGPLRRAGARRRRRARCRRHDPRACHRLDQLPLALELAAARTPLFSAEGLLERVGSRLDLLRGRRDGDPRQATLRTTIDWSYELLDEAEMRLFEAVAVFVDGCLYDAAQEVADADPDTLQSLIDKSLLRRRDSALGPRYWMLETIRNTPRSVCPRAGSTSVLRSATPRTTPSSSPSRPADAQYGCRRPDSCRPRGGKHRRGVDFALRSRRADLASLYFYGLWPWMVIRGALPEASGHIRTYLELDLESVDPQTRFAGYFGVAEMIRHLGGREEAIRLKRRMLEDLPAVSDRPFYGRDLKSVEPALLTDLAHLELDIGGSAPPSRTPGRRSQSANGTVTRGESPTHSMRVLRSPRREATSSRRGCSRSAWSRSCVTAS